jgi:hypothetical protein
MSRESCNPREAWSRLNRVGGLSIVTQRGGFVMRAGFLIAGIAAGLFVPSGPTSADDKKPAGPVVLKVASKKDKYVFDGGGKTPKEYKEDLEALAKNLEKGERVRPPKPIPVDLVLQLENTSKESVTVYVGGDTNVYKFELTGGAGVVAMNNPVAFTADFRLPKAVSIDAGKTYEIPVKAFADGNRGFSRLVFWTGPGEYKLIATYILADKEGGKGAELKSEAIKIIVAEK